MLQEQYVFCCRPSNAQLRQRWPLTGETEPAALPACLLSTVGLACEFENPTCIEVGMPNSDEESDADLRRIAAAFARPDRWTGVLQLFTSFGPVLAGCAAMYLVFPWSYLGTLALALPTGALLVRVFIVQHDCGHGSCFAGRRTNTLVGWACSLLTMTPYAHWARQHSQHHASWNNLDRTGGGSDIYSNCLTVRAYLMLSPWRRFLYRVPRHPLVANLVLPPLIFLLLYRIPFDTPRDWQVERRSVHLTNAALAGLFCTLVLLFGWRMVLLVHILMMVVGVDPGRLAVLAAAPLRYLALDGQG